MSKAKHLILGVTASIAAYKAAEIINRLKARGFELTCVMTSEAEQFITPLTLQALSGNRVVRDLFSLPDNINPAHISLAKRCDLFLIAPATAHIIAELAAGLADNVLTCLALSASAPIVIAPAMNERMYQHKITQENIARLKKLGYRFVGPRKGHLVCGGEGLGHIAKVEDIVQAVENILKRR